jgi:hypothetical protein
VLTTAKLDATGTAVVLYQLPNSGPDTVTASYSGDASYDTSNSTPVALTVQINDSAASVTASPNPAGALQPVTLNATVGSDTAFFFSVTAFGTVTFFDGATSLGSANLASGYASLKTSFAAGQHSITVVYPGNSAFKPSTSAPYTLNVGPNPTTTALTANPNPAVIGSTVTFTATVASATSPDGTVTFYDGTASIGSASLNAAGTATFTTSALAIGPHSITAAYAAATNFTASVSPPVNEVVLPFAGDFSINVTPSSRTLYTGEAAPYLAVLAPPGGWNQNVALSCGPLPENTTCAFTPATVPGGNGGSAMVIQTSAPHKIVSAGLSGTFPWQAAEATSALALLLLPMHLRGRKTLGAVLGVISLLGLSGCGAGPITGGTPTGVYNITVTGYFSQSGQTVVHSSTVQLIVKSLF